MNRWMKKLTLLLTVILCVSSFVLQASAYSADSKTLTRKLNAALIPGKLTYADLYDIDKVDKQDLQAFAKEMKRRSGKVFLKFTTLDVDKKTAARIIINPNLVKSDTGAYNFRVLNNTVESEAARTKFEKLWGKDVSVIHCLEADYGMTVVLSAKIDLTGMDTDNLVAYAYNADKKTYKVIEDAECTVDKLGFVHLQTSIGGLLLITTA